LQDGDQRKTSAILQNDYPSELATFCKMRQIRKKQKIEYVYDKKKEVAEGVRRLQPARERILSQVTGK